MHVYAKELGKVVAIILIDNYQTISEVVEMLVKGVNEVALQGDSKIVLVVKV